MTTRYYPLPDSITQTLGGELDTKLAYRVLRELKLVHERWPEDLPETLVAIHEGKIMGYPYVSHASPGCGCFYGHLSHLFTPTAIHRAATIGKRMRLKERQLTPIEKLILTIELPTTDQTASDREEAGRVLRFLKACIEYTLATYTGQEELVEEKYSQWTTEKFCRLTRRYREATHMAGTADAYRVSKAELERIENAFNVLHPQAYRTFERRFQAAWKH